MYRQSCSWPMKLVGLEPGLEAVGVDLRFYGPEDLKPRVLFFFRFHGSRHFFHRFFHICGKSSPGQAIDRERPGES